MINQQRINFQNDINHDGYFDPENETFINNCLPPPDDDHGRGGGGVIYSQILPSKTNEIDIKKQGWDDLQILNSSQPPPPPPPPSGSIDGKY